MNHREKCGPLGKGTPGKRLKNAWRGWVPVRKEHNGASLKTFVRLLATDTKDVLTEDAKEWLENK